MTKFKIPVAYWTLQKFIRELEKRKEAFEVLRLVKYWVNRFELEDADRVQ